MCVLSTWTIICLGLAGLGVSRVSVTIEYFNNLFNLQSTYTYDLIPPFQDKSICSARNCRIMDVVINLDHDEFEISKPALSY